MTASKKRVRSMIVIILLLLVSFVGIVGTCSISIDTVKKAREDQIVDVRKRDFEVIWGSLQMYLNTSKTQTEKIANAIEADIRNSFDLDDLKERLDHNDPTADQELYEIIRKHIENVHFGGVSNNRNSIIVLEGYDNIVEDFLVDPKSRESDKQDIAISGRKLSDYLNTTYNKELFSSAMQKLRNHTSGIIAMEPYNYIDNDNHTLITEMSFIILESVYVEEGFEGLKNYQFLTPIYITDTGDIFGQQDIEHGVHQDTHKFVVIQTFNLYDQLVSIKPDIGDDDYLGRLDTRYSEVLNSLYILGTISIIMITIIIIYSFSLYNMIIDNNIELLRRIDDNSENNDSDNENDS